MQVPTWYETLAPRPRHPTSPPNTQWEGSLWERSPNTQWESVVATIARVWWGGDPSWSKA